jgi:hypothetical protein
VIQVSDEGASSEITASEYAPNYYPGTANLSQASEVRIELGRDLNGLHMPFSPTSAARISGFAFDTAGKPVRGGVFLGISQRSGAVAPEPRAVSVGPDGAFTIPNVPPGEYVIQGVEDAPVGRAAEFAAQYLSVGNIDPLPVLLRTSEGAMLSGRIVIEGESEVLTSSVAIQLVPADFDFAPIIGRGPVTVEHQRDGTFRIGGVTGSPRFVLAGAVPERWYLKSVIINDSDVTDVTFDFGLRKESYSSEIIISKMGAIIGGRVLDKRGMSVPDYTVIVFPIDRGKWFANSRYLKFGRASQDGTFQISGLPPSEYFVAAVENLDAMPGSGDWLRPEVLSNLAWRAERVTAGEGQAYQLNCRLLEP